MNYFSVCNCGKWRIKLLVSILTMDLIPRVCDCGFCQSHPSAMISDTEMTVNLSGRDLN